MGGRPIQVSDETLYRYRACSVSEIARYIGCSPEGLSHLLKKRGAVRWRDGVGHLRIPRTWLQAQADAGRTLHEIADELSVKYRTLRDYCAEIGVTLRTVKMAPGFMHCPCQHEAECHRRSRLGGAVICEPGEAA